MILYSSRRSVDSSRTRFYGACIPLGVGCQLVRLLGPSQGLLAANIWKCELEEINITCKYLCILM